MKFNVRNTLFAFCALLFIAVSCKKTDEVTFTKFVKVESSEIIPAETIQNTIQAIVGDANLSSFGINFKSMQKTVISYKTTDEKNNEIEASGVILYPAEATTLNSLYSVQHGTCDFKDAPSLSTFPIEAIHSLYNNVVCMADYIGYGKTEWKNFHPYLHKESTANTCYDMLIATTEYLKSIELDYGTENHVNIIGYSQGGAATVALQQLIEKDNKLTIDKVRAGGSPLDLKETMKYLTTQNYYSHLGYVLMIINSMNVCHDLNLDYNKIFKEEYVDCIELLNNHTFEEINSILGNDVKAIFHDDFFMENYNNNPEFAKLSSAFEKNNLIEGFQPKTHLILYHSITDEIVPYINQIIAANSFTNCTAEILKATGHLEGGLEFFIRTILF